jgi:hypothetical protein
VIEDQITALRPSNGIYGVIIEDVAAHPCGALAAAGGLQHCL